MSITTVFANGGSQAVRIPRQYRFDTDRVSVQPMNGGVLLMPVRSKPTLEFLDLGTESYPTLCRIRSAIGRACS